MLSPNQQWYNKNKVYHINLLYFQQSRDVDFLVVSGIGLPVSTSTHQQYPIE